MHRVYYRVHTTGHKEEEGGGHLWEKTVWTDETETYQNDGKKKVWRRRKTGHVWRQTTLSVTHGGGNVACTDIAASGTSSLVFIYDGTSDRK